MSDSRLPEACLLCNASIFSVVGHVWACSVFSVMWELFFVRSGLELHASLPEVCPLQRGERPEQVPKSWPCLLVRFGFALYQSLTLHSCQNPQSGPHPAEVKLCQVTVTLSFRTSSTSSWLEVGPMLPYVYR